MATGLVAKLPDKIVEASVQTAALGSSGPSLLQGAKRFEHLGIFPSLNLGRSRAARPHRGWCPGAMLLPPARSFEGGYDCNRHPNPIEVERPTPPCFEALSPLPHDPRANAYCCASMPSTMQCGQPLSTREIADKICGGGFPLFSFACLRVALDLIVVFEQPAGEDFELGASIHEKFQRLSVTGRD